MTKEEVQKALDSVIAAGEKPTLRAIRSKLGRGQLGQISKHLKLIHGKTVPLEKDEELRILRRRVADLEGALDRLGKWARETYEQRRKLIGSPPPP